MKDKMNYKKRGYTLLFSIIVASVVLSIAAFILSVSRKQFILASVSRDSTMAIYAADSAIQCTIEAYNINNLATSTLVNGVAIPRSAAVNCNNESVSSSYIGLTQNESLVLYNLKNDAKITDPDQPLAFFNSNGSCAFITVIDGYDATKGGHKVIIEARGYSNNYSPPCAPSSPYNPRNVERAIRLIYND